MLTKPLDEDLLLDAIALYTRDGAGEAAGSAEMPKLVKWYFDKVSPALAGLCSTLGGTLGDSEAQVIFYEERLAPMRESFIGLISAIRRTGTKVDLTQSIRMYGLRNARNLLSSRSSWLK